MIQAIKPAAREAYDQAYKWEKEEETRFAKRLSKPVPRRRYSDMPDQPLASNANFENPAFNIITGTTNYALIEIMSETYQPLYREHELQMDLFREKFLSESLKSKVKSTKV